MKQKLKKFFIPHEENNYHPHILHAKRAVFYGSVFLSMKLIVVLFVLFLPVEVFMLPDVLKQEQLEIMALINDLRGEQNLNVMVAHNKLNMSSYAKANDMASHEYFSHVSPDGRGLDYFLKQSGYDYKVAGENLAMGFSSAKDVVEAWIKSPTHYANLIDSQYEDFGIGLETGGYKGRQTVYVAAHFGVLKEGAKQQAVLLVAEDNNLEDFSLNEKTKMVVAGSAISDSVMTGIKESDSVVNNLVSVVNYNKDRSKVYWQKKDLGTLVEATAYIEGKVSSANVYWYDHNIVLKPSTTPGLYKGTLDLKQSPEEIFKVIINPIIKIYSQDGILIENSIEWNEPLIVSPTPMEKYTKAKSSLSGITSIFSVSRAIYIGFMIFFSLALALMIFIEVKKQHHHVIVHTLLLLGLLGCLAVI